MKIRTSLLILFVLSVTLTGVSQVNDKAYESITEAELRNHIFFLASDYLKGREAGMPEYEIAAQYVASQFAAAGLEPGFTDSEGNKSWFQGVPFDRTVYDENIKWDVTVGSEKLKMKHNEDFKIMFGNNFKLEDAGLVWLGYGIEDKANGWNDFEGMDLSGKIAVVIGGAPTKDGKPVLPQEVHDRYYGPGGFQAKLGPFFRKGVAGVVFVILDKMNGTSYDEVSSGFNNVKLVYKGSGRSGRGGSFPTIYLAGPEFLEKIMPDNNKDYSDIEPTDLEGTSISGDVKILKEDVVNSSNVIGIVPGTDPVLKDEIIVIGAHLDHVAPRGGEVCNGADDNASGSSGVMEIAEAVAMNPAKRTIVFITYTAEEKGLIGSKYFISEEVFPKNQLKFNVNMDMIGRTSPKNEESRAHYVVTNKKYLNELESFISDLNKGVTDFPLIYDNDRDSPGGSDHISFIDEDIPAFFFFSGLHPDLHQPGDDADKIDYAKAESISKLGYLLAQKLGNMEVVPDFMGK